MSFGHFDSLRSILRLSGSLSSKLLTLRFLTQVILICKENALSELHMLCQLLDYKCRTSFSRPFPFWTYVSNCLLTCGLCALVSSLLCEILSFM